MNRRGFLRFAGAAPAVGLSLYRMAVTPPSAMELPLSRSVPGVHILGPTPETDNARIGKFASDDVFERLRMAFAGRSVRVVRAERPGVVWDWGAIDRQFNTSETLSSWDLSPEGPGFNFERFRYRTSRWVQGAAMAAGFGTPAPEAFRDVRFVGMPFLPDGVDWAAHYVDERSGVVMRAVVAWDLQFDHLVCRWDVLCG